MYLNSFMKPRDIPTGLKPQRYFKFDLFPFSMHYVVIADYINLAARTNILPNGPVPCRYDIIRNEQQQ